MEVVDTLAALAVNRSVTALGKAGNGSFPHVLKGISEAAVHRECFIAELGFELRKKHMAGFNCRAGFHPARILRVPPQMAGIGTVHQTKPE